MGRFQDCLINKTSRRFSEPCTIVFPDSLWLNEYDQITEQISRYKKRRT